jgi:predicted  nucleic acid-binding Zn-ribbon protein
MSDEIPVSDIIDGIAAAIADTGNVRIFTNEWWAIEKRIAELEAELDKMIYPSEYSAVQRERDQAVARLTKLEAELAGISGRCWQ